MEGDRIQKLIKHDLYLEHLCKQLEHKYDVLIRNVPLYSRKKRLIGEIDILAIRAGHCDIYEVKCSYRISKARRQLRKFKKLISSHSPVMNMFFFCGESEQLEMIV